MIDRILIYSAAFLGAFVLTLILTPLVREMNRRFGMVDKPDPRRINKVPIPRGGGLALFLGVAVTFGVLLCCFGDKAANWGTVQSIRYLILALCIVGVGYADDKFGLNPKIKLFGQLLVAFLTWYWGGFGFADIWPSIPVWLDGLLTVFWISGAINAFNLIDGLDGLASGLALIAIIGMTGAQFAVSQNANLFFCVAFMGGLLGFLRYNYHPASVFLGDSGSMFIGYTLSVVALGSHAHDSLLVSLGVPMLAMGVPIFDTSLAILRRSVRRLLRNKEEDVGNDQVMTADTDHLHHRILRAVGSNQRKAAWLLYAFAAFLVLVGLVGLCLESRAAGLWMGAVVIAAVVIARDMARVELFDVGKLLNHVAHPQDTNARRRLAKLRVPFYLVADTIILCAAFVVMHLTLRSEITHDAVRVEMSLRVIAMFICLVFFRAYLTIWSRAVPSNYFRLFLACSAGSIIGSIAIFYLRPILVRQLLAETIFYMLMAFILLVALRFARQVVRDIFYAIDCRRLIGRKDVSRILVYGTGLRYRAFRRELVRNTSANDRIIVGLIDDNMLLSGQYIGGLRVYGTSHDAPEVINELNVDTVVIACEMPDAKLKIVLDLLKPSGVKVTQFNFSEKPVSYN